MRCSRRLTKVRRIGRERSRPPFFFILMKKFKNFGELFEAAAEKHCDDEGCYLGTCPVNCLVFLVTLHMKQKLYFMLYGDIQLLKRLGNEVQ